jgi:hypothetical protein
MKSIEHLGQVKMPLWKLAARSVFSIMKIMKSNQALILPFLFKLKVKQSQQKGFIPVPLWQYRKPQTRKCPMQRLCKI